MSSDDTAASEHGADAETTEVPPPTAAEPDLAWSHDDDADEVSTNRHGRLIWAGLSVLVIAITAALILLVSTLFGRHSTNTSRPQPVSSPSVTTTVAAAPPPATVTVPPPGAVTSIPGPSIYDQNFLSLMSQEGWGCTDNSDAEQCRKQMVSFAHQICSYSGQSIDLIYQNFGLPSFLGPREERRAIANAEQAYPNCTFTGSP